MKVLCIGRNYVAHIAELNNAVPSAPVFFLKPATAVLKDNADFYYPSFTTNLHYECELVLRIGKNGKHIQPAFALNYIDGYTLGVDFTARDLQDAQKAKGLPWEIAKAFDQSAVVGNIQPVSVAQLQQPFEFDFYQNKVHKQHGNTNLMMFSIVDIICKLSQYFTLQKGDLIFTGTPEGVAAVNIGDNLVGKIGDETLFNFNIK